MRKGINQQRVRTWEAAAGACCFLAGILAALLGSIVTAGGWFLGAELHPWLHAAGTALLVVAIPLILFAGFCLDWAERGKEKPPHDPQKAQRGAAILAEVATAATILGVVLLGPPVLHAQQTIFNVPTTDVLDTRGLNCRSLSGSGSQCSLQTSLRLWRKGVENPSGSEHEVLVQIDEEAVGYVERMTRRQLPAGNSFRTGQAERLLSDYLWKEGKVPPTRKLAIKDVDRDELPMAARWQNN